MEAQSFRRVNYYVMYDNAQMGPLAELEIRNLYELGSITGHTLVWCDNIGDWVSLQNLPEFRSLFEA